MKNTTWLLMLIIMCLAGCMNIPAQLAIDSKLIHDDLKLHEQDDKAMYDLIEQLYIAEEYLVLDQEFEDVFGLFYETGMTMQT